MELQNDGIFFITGPSVVPPSEAKDNRKETQAAIAIEKFVGSITTDASSFVGSAATVSTVSFHLMYTLYSITLYEKNLH